MDGQTDRVLRERERELAVFRNRCFGRCNVKNLLMVPSLFGAVQCAVLVCKV